MAYPIDTDIWIKCHGEETYQKIFQLMEDEDFIEVRRNTHSFSRGEDVKLYRGVTDKNKEYTEAVSWTSNIDVAYDFAIRMGQEGKVWKISAKKGLGSCS